MRKIFSKISLAMFAAVLAIPIVGPLVAKAAADSSYASGSEMIQNSVVDNKQQTFLMIGGVGVVIILIVLFLAFLRWVRRQASGVFGGGRRR